MKLTDPANNSTLVDTDQFRDQRIAVIGNSVRIFDNIDGAEIDGHDIVIRFNLAWPELAMRPECTGSKTTHMLVGGREFKTSESAENFARLRRDRPGTFFFSAKGDPTTWTTDSPVPLLPDETFQNWRDEQDTSFAPSSGILMIYYLLKYCSPNQISVFGFDGFESPIWYKKQKFLHAPCHSPQVARRYLDHVARTSPLVSITTYKGGHLESDAKNS